MRDDMKKGDLVLFYHSNCDEPSIVGVAEIVSEAYPDHTAFDPESHYFDPKSDPDNPRWFMVDLRYRKKFRNTLSLKDLKAHPILSSMRVAQKGSRLSITPVTADEWQMVHQLVGESPGKSVTDNKRSG